MHLKHLPQLTLTPTAPYTRAWTPTLILVPGLVQPLLGGGATSRAVPPVP